jgi:hypothetical protein
MTPLKACAVDVPAVGDVDDRDGEDRDRLFEGLQVLGRDVGDGAAVGCGARHVGLARGQRGIPVGQGVRRQGRVDHAQAGMYAAPR